MTEPKYRLRASGRISVCYRTKWRAVGCVLICSLALLAGPMNSSAFGQSVVDQEPASPRAIASLFGLDESQLRFLTDGVAVNRDELEIVHHLASVLTRVDAVTLESWSREHRPLDSIVEQPDGERLEPFTVRGFVQEVERQPLPKEAATRFAFSAIYRVTLTTLEPVRELSIWTASIPVSWQTWFDAHQGRVAESTRLPASVTGVFLKVGGPALTDSTANQLVFAAANVAWHPNRIDTQFAIGRGLAELGAVGFDVSLFEGLVQRTRLVSEDRECFYRLLSAAPRARASGNQRASSKLDVVRAIQKPARLAGERVTIHGLARRAIKIRVPDPDIQDRMGIAHYYEVEIFQPLENSIQLVDAATGDEQTHHRFPITICCRRLPKGMATGDEIRQSVEADGYFFKLRSYRTGRSTRESPEYQLSPLVVAASLRLVDEESSTSDPLPAWLLAGVIFGGAAVALVIRQWFRIQDRRFVQWRRAADKPPQFTDVDASQRHR